MERKQSNYGSCAELSGGSTDGELGLAARSLEVDTMLDDIVQESRS